MLALWFLGKNASTKGKNEISMKPEVEISNETSDK